MSGTIIQEYYLQPSVNHQYNMTNLHIKFGFLFFKLFVQRFDLNLANLKYYNHCCLVNIIYVWSFQGRILLIEKKD